MSNHHHDKKNSHCEDNIEAKKIRVRDLCAKNVKAVNTDIKSADIDCATINCADIDTLDVSNIYVGGKNITCSLTNSTPAVSTFSYSYVDITVPGVQPPQNVDPVVFNALLANAFENQKSLECRIYDGRCCIYNYLKAQGCPDTCPPPALGEGPTGCAVNFTGSISDTTLTVSGPLGLKGLEPGLIVLGNNVAPDTEIVSQISGDTGGVGNYVVSVSQEVSEEQMSANLSCIPNCPLVRVPLKIFGALTLPIYRVVNCGPTGATGTTGANCSCIGNTGAKVTSYNSLTTAVTFNLQCTYLLEVAKSIDARAVSVLVQVGYYDKLTDSVVINDVFIANKQMYPTLDVLYGENFANTISIPTPILADAYRNSLSDPTKQGAIQMVVYEEEGICIWNPIGDGFECRGSGDCRQTGNCSSAAAEQEAANRNSNSF